nr:alpha/beta hydrolase-fold protein [uncultured Holophaga sp.]
MSGKMKACAGGVLLLSTLGGFAAADPVRSVTAITEVRGDGQHVCAVAVEYDGTLDGSRLRSADFSVKGAKVARVYANGSAARAGQGVDGSFAIIELEPAPRASTRMPGPPPGAGKVKGGPPAGGGPKLGQLAQDSPSPEPLRAEVTQRGELRTVAGQVLPAGGTWTSTRTLDLGVRDFRQAVYRDPRFPGQPLMYNLFVPEHYQTGKAYPLVLFMHDAGAVSLDPRRTLTQGLGAIAFASPEAQAAHECFVLAPQYDRVIVGDGSKTADQVEITVDLVKELEGRYSIDQDRVYNTGQSMGGMTSIAMDIKYPGLFAASLLVACQWDPAQVAPMAGTPLWVVVSEGDQKAKPGQDAILAVLKAHGATVSQATWSAEAPEEEVRRQAEALAVQDTRIHYTVYQGGDHRYTWQFAYGTPAFRDWLFRQARTGGRSARELSRRGEQLVRAGDPSGAFPFLKRAAELGEGRACTQLGLLYLDGHGAPASAAQALELFDRGTALGDFKAPRWAGIIHLEGRGGLPVDAREAARCFSLAAGKGDVTAHYYLGLLYERGLVYPQDFARAAECYAQAAPATGHAEGVACSALGRLYEQGLGVTRDLNKAQAWYQRGAGLGDVASLEALHRLELGASAPRR